MACGEERTKSLVYLTALLLASVCFQTGKVKIHGAFQKFGKLKKGFGMDLSCHRYFRLMNRQSWKDPLRHSSPGGANSNARHVT